MDMFARSCAVGIGKRAPGGGVTGRGCCVVGTPGGGGRGRGCWPVGGAVVHGLADIEGVRFVAGAGSPVYGVVGPHVLREMNGGSGVNGAGCCRVVGMGAERTPAP